ncbi:MAG: DUF4038 domain-containing protein [Opitutaceae bacterium]
MTLSVPTDGEETRFDVHGRVQVSDNRRHLQHEDGTPFFWLADTAWNGPLLASEEDWDLYLKDRATKGFTAIQFVAHAPWRAAEKDADGRTAWLGRTDPTINPAFYDRVEKFVKAINDHNMLAAPILMWTCTPDDPGQYLSEEAIIPIVRYEIERLKKYQVLWILAGDGNYVDELGAKWRRIGRQIFPPTRDKTPVAMHLCGMNLPYKELSTEPWLDIWGYQSGHGDDNATLAWIHSGPVAFSWPEDTRRAFINFEPPYEGHRAYQSGEPHSDFSVRRAAYWSLLNAPTAGVTYGAQGIWSWQTEAGEPLNHEGTGIAPPWHEALQLPGSSQMGILAGIFNEIRWWQLRPNGDLLRDQPGMLDPRAYISTAQTPNESAVVLYLPLGGRVALNSTLANRTGTRFDPRKGDRQLVTVDANADLDTPADQDWVVVLD